MAAPLSELSFRIDCFDFTSPRLNVHLSENIEKIPKANNGEKRHQEQFLIHHTEITDLMLQYGSLTRMPVDLPVDTTSSSN